MKTLKRRLEFERNARNWNLGDVSRITGIPSSRISGIERGTTTPNDDDLELLAQAFGLKDPLSVIDVGYIVLQWDELISGEEIVRQEAELLKRQLAFN